MLKDDYMMRQIDMLSRTVASLVFKKESVDYAPEAMEAQAGADALYFAVHKLVEAGKIDKAEDMLYEDCDLEDIRYLEVAVDFYAHLNNLSDKDLEAGGFSREEIEEGLRDLLNQFGVVLP